MFFTCGTVLFAQDRDHNNDHRNKNLMPPQTVQQAWQRDHANDGNANWKYTNGQWHATYTDHDNNRNAETFYDGRGRKMETHREWDKTQMAPDYDQRINRKYHTNGNYTVNRIERPNQKEMYEVKLKDKGRSRTIYTDDKGNEIRYRPQGH